MASVEFRNLRKSFGAVEVIHGIDLQINEGEFLALVGPSGCGKSTLLRILAGLEEATSGDIVIDGQVVNTATPRQRNIAMVFQNYALYPHMTVAQNMSFNLRISRLSKAEIEKRVTDAAKLLELEPYLDRRPAHLSGGQRQRVAMGRAIVRNPAAYLFDEPLSNLDAKLRVQMRTEIKALHQKVGTTSIYVTHDQIEAMTLADRIAVLKDGHIEQVGTPIDLYRNPANKFVAGFIGSPSMNFIDCRVRRTTAGLQATLPGGNEIALPNGLDVRQDKEITIGLRPEDLRPGKVGSQISGKALFVEPTGAQTFVQFESDGIQMMAVIDGSEDVQAGQPFSVSLDFSRIHVFDKDTAKRLY
ncbi:ABC transporter ATP-binding protein [Pseudoruegeria sp. HB172150]|uniref:ABC transporter ATP-binding protein n=1 Tax=Pseudoruegeria sp. HB172150 TaxID=2721164 RepID=UPI0015539F72|nr:sn-glycerol-3-phosphate ABC transporter ATP-binding protein UgpC [Pseudoruegeria sp. HB172150]